MGEVDPSTFHAFFGFSIEERSPGGQSVVRLLNANLKEELSAAKKITAAGIPILKQSAAEPTKPEKPKTGKEKYSAELNREDEKKAARDLKKE